MSKKISGNDSKIKQDFKKPAATELQDDDLQQVAGGLAAGHAALATDPIVRSYKELGRLFLLTRILVLVGLIAVLYYGLGYFSLTGMISTAVGALLVEKVIGFLFVQILR